MEENLIISSFTMYELDKISNTLEKDFDDFWNYNILKKELENSSSIYLCCKQNDEIVGFAGVSIILDTAELNNIVIKKSKRGLGLSIILLKELIKASKSRGCTKINLEVSVKNNVAIGLYQKLGFKQVGRRNKYYNGDDALLFTLDF